MREIGLREKNFKAHNYFQKILISIIGEKMQSIQRYSFQKIAFTAYDLHKDHPPLWVLKSAIIFYFLIFL